MRSIKVLIVAVVLALVLGGCSSKKKDDAVSFGELKDNVYTNSFFNIEVTVPSAWFMMDDESRIELMKQGSKIVSGDNKNLKAVMDAADFQTMNLLTAYESAPGSAVSTNPSIMVIAEKIGHMPGIKRGSDYHFHTKQLMGQSALSVTFPSEIYEENLDGVSFDVMEIEIELPQGSNYQNQYCTVIKDYALLVIITFQDDEGLQQLKGLLQEIKFS